MSLNKKAVETYLSGVDNLDRSALLSCLAEDAERAEWADGFPESGIPQQGREAIIQNVQRPSDVIMRSEIERLTEENNVVVSENIVRLSKKEEVFLTLKVCSVFELENGKIKRINSFTAEIKPSDK